MQGGSPRPAVKRLQSQSILSAENNPVVSVIVPARNEEACLGRCLESLVAQEGNSFEVIVVDDASSDRTGEIARSFSEITVISAPPLPENWTGKNNAMAAGARIARGKWLLFTDADTFHKSGSLARAVAEAEEHGAALLSYSPEQEVHGFLQRAVMPVIFAELAATYPPSKVNDPSSSVAAANGQYLMISREAYDAVGGHTKIARDLLEDVAMARLVKSSGRKIFFRYGGDAVQTRMYRSWPQMKEGWTKNLAVLFPRPRELAAARLAEFIAVPFGILLLIAAMRLPSAIAVAVRWCMIAGGLCVLLWAVASLFRRVRKAHFPLSNIWASYVGLAVFAYLLLRSERAYKRSRFEWKDRTYVYTPDEFKELSAARSKNI
jgi:glycosyltransferase involved in cell wall biosynthesis